MKGVIEAVDKGYFYEEVEVSSGTPILQDLTLDSAEKHLLILTPNAV